MKAALDIDIMVYNNLWFAGYQLTPNEAEMFWRSRTVHPDEEEKLI